MRTIYVEKNLPRMLLMKTAGSIWPGLVWTPLSPARVAEVGEPPLPGPRGVRVRNRLGGICASDLTFLFVHVDPAVAPAAMPGTERLYLGHESVGEVVEVGPAVTRFKVGDRVVMDTLASFAPHCLSLEISPPCRYCERGEYNLCEKRADCVPARRGAGGGWGDGYTAHETEVYAVPPDLSDEQAVLIEPAAVALHAVLRQPPVPGAKVLVVGAGMAGLLITQAVRAVCPECFIAVMAKHPHQIEMATRLGADTVVKPTAGYAAAARLSGARLHTAPFNKGMFLGGFDVVYDCIGTGRTVEDSLRWARAGGTVVLVGIRFERLRLDLTPTWYQEVNLIGSLVHGMDEWQGRRRHTYEWVIELMRAGKLGDTALITHRFRFEDYKQAIITAGARHSGAIRVVFDYR